VVAACAELRREVPAELDQVEALVFAAARQTFVPVTAGGEPLGQAILWSDRRAGAEATELAATLGGFEAVHRRTGVPMHAGSVAPKIAWLATHEPDRLASCRWLLSARDLLVWRLTGEVTTDPSMASCMGLADLDGRPVEALVGAAVGRLAPAVQSTDVVGHVKPGPAAQLGLPAGVAVVVGAGDRQCEVLGTGASAGRPMVSWGTTANVSVPVHEVPPSVPAGAMISRSGTGEWLKEAGLSAGGSWLAWLSRLTGRDIGELADLAAQSPPGARGVVAVPWLDGARAPWWNDDARAGFVGIGADHDAGDVARAVIESVAWEAKRCIDALTTDRQAVGLTMAVTAGARLWTDVLTGVTGLPATRRRSGDAASAGAALLAASALHLDWDLDRLDPIEDEHTPDPALVARYRAFAERTASVASAVVRLPPADD
jgi:sugar (pentulose or hexulose) kinase